MSQQGIAQQSLIDAQAQMSNQEAAGQREYAALQRDLSAFKVSPSQPISKANSSEVQRARRQSSVDAFKRTGMRKSIIAGNSTPKFTGSAGSAPARKSILG